MKTPRRKSTLGQRGALPLWPWLVAALALLTTGIASAQIVPEQAPPEKAVPPASLAQTVDDQGRAIDELRVELKASKEEISRLDNQLETLRSEQEDVALFSEGQKAELEYIRIYGFFDTTLSKFFIGRDSGWNLYVPDTLTFLMNNINIYLTSQMTQTTSALVELRFSFLPVGVEKGWAGGLQYGDGPVMDVPDTKYERWDTKIRDPFNAETYSTNSVIIERVHFTWAPRDWFNVVVGRYLTPYGIWNVDHASTVVLPVRMPYMQVRRMIPPAQTGLMVSGRFYPTGRLFLDYAITVSNGFGPTESSVDFDDDKAIGAKLHLDYQSENVSVGGGVYAIYGTWADRIEKVIINPQTESLRVQITDYDVTDEVAISADFRLRLFGLIFNSEYLRHYTFYSIPPTQNVGDPERALVIKDFDANHLYYLPSNIGWGWYGLLGYELPLRRWLGEMILTPYVMFELNRVNDTRPSWCTDLLIAGLNFKPSRFVAIKAEWNYAMPQSKSNGGNVSVAALQLAVSF